MLSAIEVQISASPPFFYADMYIWTVSHPPPPLPILLFQRNIIGMAPPVWSMAVTNLHVGFLDVSLKLLGVSHVWDCSAERRRPSVKTSVVEMAVRLSFLFFCGFRLFFAQRLSFVVFFFFLIIYVGERIIIGRKFWGNAAMQVELSTGGCAVFMYLCKGTFLSVLVALGSARWGMKCNVFSFFNAKVNYNALWRIWQSKVLRCFN